MATKLKKYKGRTSYKVILIVIFALCIGFIFAIADYVAVNGNLRNCADILFEGNYIQSNTHFSEVRNALYRISGAGNGDLSAAEQEIGNVDFYYAVLDIDGENNFSYASNLPPSALPPSYVTQTDSIAAFTDAFTDLNIYNGVEFYRVTADEDILKSNRTSNKVTNATVNSAYQTREYDAVFVGFDGDYLDVSSIEWLHLHDNFLLLFILCIIAGLVALIIFIRLIIIAGRGTEGELKPPNGLMNWYTEIQWAITLMLAYFALLLLYELFRNEIAVFNSVDFYVKGIVIAASGLTAAVLSAWTMAMVISAAIKLKNHCFWQRTIVGAVCIRVCKWLKKAGCSVKGIITGETFKANGLVRSIVIRLSVFFGFSLLMLILGLISACIPSSRALLFFFFLECLAIGAFIFGICTTIRDIDRLDTQIDLIHKGELDVKQTISEKSPFYNTSAKVLSLGESMQASITERVKAERLKIDLVTNVSHDLKTPLTSIISYISLLEKEEGLSPEAVDYVRILSMKSDRLKNIVFDLFELAKTPSGDITVERERIDLTRLIRQTLGDMEDKIDQTGLTVREKLPSEPVMILSDGKRLYRVLQNLLDNALKYSLQGSRIYTELTVNNGRAEISVKNTSSYEMNFTKEEILERFTRGDKSRSTEGSGLGLSIAQGLTIACGGSFDIEVDGDLFKAVLSFYTVE